jgi:predicted RecB family nuclease
MHIDSDRLIFAATDLASFLACRHRVGLDMAAAHGHLTRPYRTDRFVVALQDKGKAHERRFVDWLRTQHAHVVDLTGAADPQAETMAALEAGADVVVQAALGSDGWLGYADILRRVERPSRFGAWSYEACDTKLARETRGGTILQLALYSDLLAALQGETPEWFHVVTPAGAPPYHRIHSYRAAEYAAYYRLTRRRFTDLAAGDAAAVQDAHYPEPVEHCDVCHWWDRCHARRRADDHLSFIAGIGRDHRAELTAHGVPTLAAAAAMPVPIPFAPSRGSAETYGRFAHQARVQHAQRKTGTPVVERLPVQDDAAAAKEGATGLRRLPAPSAGDLFLDLEGARFARDGGREYLFGLWGPDGYRAWWAFDDREEKTAFEAALDCIGDVLARHPDAHVYHFNHYEPTAFKRLAGRHVTRAEALDALLRGERFVDLLPIVRQSVRAGVESYSIKQLEQYYGFTRDVDLRAVSTQLQAMELALEGGGDLHGLAPDLCAAIEGYNRDDCRSAAGLRDWLESLRADVERGGTAVPRPVAKAGEAPETTGALEQEVEALRVRLLDGLAPDAADSGERRSPALAARVPHRLASPRVPGAVVGILPPGRSAGGGPLRRAEGAGRSCVRRRLGFKTRKDRQADEDGHRPLSVSPQDVEIRAGKEVWGQDGSELGIATAVDREARTIDIEKGPNRADTHPAAIFEHSAFRTRHRAARRDGMAQRALDGDTAGCGFDLLHRRTPRLASGSFAPRPGEASVDVAVRIVTEPRSHDAGDPGPPRGRQDVRGCANDSRARPGRPPCRRHRRQPQGDRQPARRGGRQAAADGETVRLAHRSNDHDDVAPGVQPIADNETARAAIAAHEVDVLGGTVYLWARPELAGSVDVLFVDEAGQMSLANALAVAQAARASCSSAIRSSSSSRRRRRIPTARTSPRCSTSSARRRRCLPIAASSWTTRGGSRRPCAGSRRSCSTTITCGPTGSTGSASPARNRSTAPGSGGWRSITTATATPRTKKWMSSRAHRRRAARPGAVAVGRRRRDRAAARARRSPRRRPFNAQVNRLHARLAPRGVPVGTVDRFQGQTAAVVIYSMATSRPEDAPRGMEFLYSLNRLNVATSRARCAAIVVASPRLVAPDCRTPRQMQLANALCRFRELAVEWRGDA